MRPTGVQSFLGLMQIKKIKKIIKKRYENFLYFKNNINKNLWKPAIRKNTKISNMVYPILSRNRKKLIKKLSANNIECRPIISGSLKKQPFFRRHSLNHAKKFPNADFIHNYGLYIGLNPMIDNSKFQKMIKTIKFFFNN